VIVDTTKKTPTRYTYSGGVSTVLTGGVMLGSSRSSTPRKAGSGASGQKGGKGKADATPVWKPRAKMTPSRDAGDWRRGGATRV
jgi:hypothetical protein